MGKKSYYILEKKTSTLLSYECFENKTFNCCVCLNERCISHWSTFNYIVFLFLSSSLSTLDNLKRTILSNILMEQWRILNIHTPPLHWRHNGRDCVSNHQPYNCLLNGLFGRRSKKTSKLRVTGLCEGNSPGTGEFPAQMASYAENVSIWWRHHVPIWQVCGIHSVREL